jgi:hypothetical protein
MRGMNAPCAWMERLASARICRQCCVCMVVCGGSGRVVPGHQGARRL